MAKIFVSYKYGDNQVDQSRLDKKYWAVKTNPFTGKKERVSEATGRGYTNYIQELLASENDIYKGEKEDESLEGKTNEQIWEILKPRIHDSTVTLVVISKGMKDISRGESNQWMPTEIRYSLWDIANGGRRSLTNALLGIIIPDCNGSYEYIYRRSNCSLCSNINFIDKINNPYLFKILKGNIYNRKNDSGEKCKYIFCSTIKYYGEHSYLHLATFNEFCLNPKVHVDKAIENQRNIEDYDIKKIMCPKIL